MNKLSELNVVVVDDSDFYRSIICKMLAEEGVNVVGEAASAEAALVVIKDKNPDIVITDIVMPEISGIELTEKISQNYPNISVIVISSLAQEHIVLEAIGAGASDFIAKPVQKQQLMDSLEKLTNK
ncbi:MAG: response regulator [Bacteriovoracaceae bacterium]|nr:response regulator [Bacteriovoracaceae bacterium]